MVTTDLPQFAGTSCRPCQRCTVNVLSACAWPTSVVSQGPRTYRAPGQPAVPPASDRLPAASGYEYRQGSHFAAVLHEQRGQAAVGPERGDRRVGRPDASPRCWQPDTVRHEAGLLGGQPQVPEGRRGGLRQRDELELAGQLIERSGIFDPVRTDPRAAERGQMTAGAQSPAKVAGDGPDVRAG